MNFNLNSYQHIVTQLSIVMGTLSSYKSLNLPPFTREKVYLIKSMDKNI